MTEIDDPVGATTAEISDELIYLIASVSSDDQRKYATELFRHFARRVALEAFMLGQKSMAMPQLVSQPADPFDPGSEAHPAPTTQPADDASVGLIPPVRWQD